MPISISSPIHNPKIANSYLFLTPYGNPHITPFRNPYTIPSENQNTNPSGQFSIITHTYVPNLSVPYTKPSDLSYKLTPPVPSHSPIPPSPSHSLIPPSPHHSPIPSPHSTIPSIPTSPFSQSLIPSPHTASPSLPSKSPSPLRDLDPDSSSPGSRIPYPL